MAKAPSRPALRARWDRRRAEVVDGAARVFAERGYDRRRLPRPDALPMTNLPLDGAAGRTAADLVHHKLTATPAATTVAEIRAFFAASESRRLAVLVDDDGRFAGVLSRDDAEAAPDADAAASTVARPGPTIAADAPADAARDAALADPSRRVPVVAEDGTLLGVVAIDKTLTVFCGVEAPAG